MRQFPVFLFIPNSDEWNWDKWTGQEGAEAKEDTWLEEEGDYQPHCEDPDFVVRLLCIASRCPSPVCYLGSEADVPASLSL